MQQQLEIVEVEDAQKLFDACMEILDELTRDVFGNYVIQKFFDYGTMEQRTALCDRFKGQVLDMSLQIYGCRVIQKALETASCDDVVKQIQRLGINSPLFKAEGVTRTTDGYTPKPLNKKLAPLEKTLAFSYL